MKVTISSSSQSAKEFFKAYSQVARSIKNIGKLKGEDSTKAEAALKCATKDMNKISGLF